MLAVVEGLALPRCLRDEVAEVYGDIARAEAKVHGTEPGLVHFHEVGAMDAVADVALACLLMAHVSPDKVAASPVNVGSGTVRCAHGVMSVPTPATAELLHGLPVYGGDVRGELCTPTGAALVAHFAATFGQMPPMVPEAVGRGMGTREFDRPNCVTAYLGEASEPAQPAAPVDDLILERVVELACNVDDMTGEDVGTAIELLLEAGALDAWAQPIVMKKSRPAFMVCALALPGSLDAVRLAMLRHTTTLGVRERAFDRRSLAREQRRGVTSYGEVGFKASSGTGFARVKVDHDDLARLAREHGTSIAEVRRTVERELFEG